ncbi:Ankyrin-3 [Dactylellina cionopaga]|nr:Ankyrin-3 [Dactylellina cionopaga]
MTGETAYDRAYENAMERIRCQNSSESEDLANQVLSWIIFAKRPLNISELQHAVAVELGESEFDEENVPEINDMVSACAGLVTVDEQSHIIRLVHFTTQEYFERTRNRWFPEAQDYIAKTCVSYISYSEFNTGPCSTDQDFEARINSKVLYDYAAQTWGDHARESPIAATPLVLKFLENKAGVLACTQAMNTHRLDQGYSQLFRNLTTGVHLAAHFGLWKSLMLMLDNGFNLETKDRVTDGKTPLILAAQNGHEATVKLLIDKGADLEAEDNYYYKTALCWAAESGHKRVVELLMDKGANPNVKIGYYHFTPFSRAVKNGHEAVVKLLIMRGIDPDVKDGYGRTPLSRAAEDGNERLVDLLMDSGADLESKDRDDRTPLSWAASHGHETVRTGAEHHYRGPQGVGTKQ